MTVRREVSDSEDEITKDEQRMRRKVDFSSRQTAVYDDGTNTFFW